MKKSEKIKKCKEEVASLWEDMKKIGTIAGRDCIDARIDVRKKRIEKESR